LGKTKYIIRPVRPMHIAMKKALRGDANTACWL